MRRAALLDCRYNAVIYTKHSSYSASDSSTVRYWKVAEFCLRFSLQLPLSCYRHDSKSTRVFRAARKGRELRELGYAFLTRKGIVLYIKFSSSLKPRSQVRQSLVKATILLLLLLVLLLVPCELATILCSNSLPCARSLLLSAPLPHTTPSKRPQVSPFCDKCVFGLCSASL